MASSDRPPIDEPVARVPKYYAVKQHLLEYIERLPPGALVPTERDLAAQLTTSRTTVRQALIELAAEGRLVRRQGAGTFVADEKITWPLHLASFTQQAAANGLSASSRLLAVERVKAGAEVAARLGLRPQDPVHKIDRLRLADDRPMTIESSLMSAARFPYLGRKIRRAGSLHALLHDDYGVSLQRGEESIDIAAATPQQAALLSTDTGAPMLVVRRCSFDGHGDPVEWCTSWFRGDRVTFIARLRTPGR